MSKEITATLVHKTSNQRFYKLNVKLSKHIFYGKVKDTLSELIKEKNLVKDKYKDLIPTDGYELVCISDAHTHIERLAFLAVIVNEEPARTHIQIDGVHTMMIHGGDSRRVYSDFTYIRRLAKVNGYQLINEKVEVKS